MSQRLPLHVMQFPDWINLEQGSIVIRQILEEAQPGAHKIDFERSDQELPRLRLDLVGLTSWNRNHLATRARKEKEEEARTVKRVHVG